MTRAAAPPIALLALYDCAAASHPVPPRLFFVRKQDASVETVVWKVREPHSTAAVRGDPIAHGAIVTVPGTASTCSTPTSCP